MSGRADFWHIPRLVSQFPYARYNASACFWGEAMPEIVIADDDSGFLEVLSAFSERAGWSVKTCLNGGDILAAVSEGRSPVLVLIDINMPVMDGIAAIEEIILVKRPMRLRFMSGGADAPMLAAKMIAQARDLPVGNSIYKPVEREKYVAMLGEEAILLDAMSVTRNGWAEGGGDSGA
ncbi:response regulator [Rhodobacteraceae bacterium D3-12]|nr:response regulator [Rhodobacteraceae bacterium D3-12]